MITQRLLSLRDVADALDLDRARLFRLGRAYYLAPVDPCIPATVVDEAKEEADREERYRLVLSWVLTNLPGNGSAH